jgi:hypothetical protein
LDLHLDGARVRRSQGVAHDVPALAPVPAPAPVCHYLSCSRRTVAMAEDELKCMSVKPPQPMDTDIDTASGAAGIAVELASVAWAGLAWTRNTSMSTLIVDTSVGNMLTGYASIGSTWTGDMWTGDTSIEDTWTGGT